MTLKPGSGKAPLAPAAARGFELQLSCPHCGGPFVVTDATVSHVCEHCTSLLIIEAPEREEVFVEPARVSERAAILETLIRYRVDAHRSTLVAKHSDGEGNPPPELMISALLTRFESALRASARIVDCRLVHVPYRHTAGKIVQAVLGRPRGRPSQAPASSLLSAHCWANRAAFDRSTSGRSQKRTASGLPTPSIRTSMTLRRRPSGRERRAFPSGSTAWLARPK